MDDPDTQAVDRQPSWPPWQVAFVAVAVAIVGLSVFREASAGWQNLGATSISNCKADVDLTTTGVYELAIALVTASLATLVALAWYRRRGSRIVWSLVGIIVISWILWAVVDLTSGKYQYC